MLTHDETSENSGSSQVASSASPLTLYRGKKKPSSAPKLQQLFTKLWMFQTKWDKGDIMPISNSKIKEVALERKLEHYITKHVITYNDICC